GVVEDGVFGRGGGHKAGRELRVGDVVHHLAKDAWEIEFVAQRRSVEMILFEPAEAFAMRTIGKHAHQIAALRPADESADAIEQNGRAFEIGGGRGGGVGHGAFGLDAEGRFSSRPVPRAFQPGVPNGGWKAAGTGRLESLPYIRSGSVRWIELHLD